MNKIIKILIIFIIAAIIILFVISRFFTVQKGSGVQQSTGNNQGLGSLPISINKQSAVRVENIENDDQIKKAYEEYTKQDANNFPANEKTGISDSFPLEDKNGKMLPLDFFLSNVDAKINPKIKSIIGTNYYGLFYCENNKKEKEYGISFDIGSEDSSKIKDYNAKAKDYMNLWEPYMFKDLHNIIFPQVSPSEQQLNQPLTFKEGKFRYTEVNLPNGKGSINYSITDYPINRIYISASQECLDKAIRFLFDF